MVSKAVEGGMMTFEDARLNSLKNNVSVLRDACSRTLSLYGPLELDHFALLAEHVRHAGLVRLQNEPRRCKTELKSRRALDSHLSVVLRCDADLLLCAQAF